jgi:hypothetical protein
MVDGFTEYQKSSPACQEEIKACRKALGLVQLGLVDSLGRLRRALSLLPPGEVQVGLAKAVQQRFQPGESPLREIIQLSAQLEAMARGGDLAEIERRVSGNILKEIAKQVGGVAVDILDGHWRFAQEVDPSMLAAQDRMKAMLAAHAANDGVPPED